MQRLVAAIVAASIVGAVMLSGLAWAQNPDGSVTLTPSKLYSLIEVEQKKSARQTAILELLRGRVSEVQKDLDGVRERANSAAINHEPRIVELERKLALQAKGIGNLSVKLQESRDQVARLIKRLDNKKADK